MVFFFPFLEWWRLCAGLGKHSTMKPDPGLFIDFLRQGFTLSALRLSVLPVVGIKVSCCSAQFLVSLNNVLLIDIKVHSTFHHYKCCCNTHSSAFWAPFTPFFPVSLDVVWESNHKHCIYHITLTWFGHRQLRVLFEDRPR